MTSTDENPVLDFELSHPGDAAALWTQVTDGNRITLTGSEAATLYRQLVLQRLAAHLTGDGTDAMAGRA